MFGKNLARAAIVACAFAGSGAANAQSFAVLGGDKAELREEQKAIFSQMFQDPDNLELMFSYALVSIKLEDLEAAISTLERMLIYNKDLPRVHMELGAAYYRLGSYQTASYYFNNVLAFNDVPPVVVAKANEFLRAIEQRTEKSVFVGTVSTGITYASNATLGPDDASVLLFGLPAVLAPEFLEDDDFGIKTTAALSHFYDLEQPDSDFWRTDASVFSLHYFDATDSDVDSFLVSTGPQISLDDKQFGPKLRPFVELDYVRSSNDSLYATASIGGEYTDTLSDTLSIFGSLRGGYRDYFGGRDDFDAFVVRATAGAAYTPMTNVVLRGAAYLERTDADENFNSNIEGTLRASATYSYDSGFDFAGRLWNLTGFAQVTGRQFDDPNPVLVGNAGTKERRDIDLRAGVRHVFYLQDGLWLAADVDGLSRSSNIGNFDLKNFGGGISVGLDF